MSRKKGAIYSYVLLIIEVLSGFFLTPFLIKSLGQSEYGVYSIVISISAYFLLLDLGIGNATVKYISQFRFQNDKIKLNAYVSIVLLFYGIVSLIVIILGFLVFYNFELIFSRSMNNVELMLSKRLLILVIINSIILLFSGPLKKVMIGFEDFILSRVVLISRIFLRTLILFGFLYFGTKSFGVILVDLVINAVLVLILLYILIVRYNFRLTIKNIDSSFIREILAYSMIIFVQMVATQLNLVADKIILGILTSTSVVSIYSVGSQLSSYFQSMSGGINGILMPGVVKMVYSKPNSSNYQNEFTHISRIVMMMLSIIWVVFLLYGKEFIIIWIGNVYIESYYVFLIISFPMIFSLSQSVGSQMLWAINKHKKQAIIKVTVSITNIFLTILLIYWKPLIGASLGTAIAIFLGDVVAMNFVLKKEIGIQLLKYYKDYFKGIAMSLLISGFIGLIIINFIDDSLIGFLIKCSTVVVTYGICLIIFGFSSREKTMLIGVFKKIILKRGRL